MLEIFKWFFGIIGVIILVYVLIVIVRTVIGVGSSTIATVATSTQVQNNIASTAQPVVAATTGFSLADWVRGFHPFNFAPVYVGLEPNSSTTPTRGAFYGDEFNPNPNVTNWQNATSANWQANLMYQNLNDAPDDHPTDWMPVDGSAQMYSNSTNPSTNANSNKPKADSKYITPYLNDNSVIKNDQVITGFAYYKVFSNRIFPIFILDQSGRQLGVVKAFVNGDLQANGFVPFRAVMSLPNIPAQKGILVFKNDNAEESGIQAATMVPIIFKRTLVSKPITMPSLLYTTGGAKAPNPLNNRCVIGGCSMQFCGEQSEIQNLVSTCEWREAYACYQNAVCERNTDTGRCGWRIDSSLATCLQYGN